MKSARSSTTLILNERWSNTISNFIGRSNVKIQTLHPSSTSYDEEKEPGNLWLDNKDIKLERLL
jgi:hypothetical protein